MLKTQKLIPDNTSFQKPSHLKKLICSICSKKFLSKSALKAHTKFIHQHLNIFNCPFENCNKFFNTQYRLDIHMMIHKGIKPYKCELCNKTFTEQGTLRTHLVTHSIVKPFKCELCEYRCKTNPQLRHHYKKEHHEANYYKCPKCYMKFNKKAELKHHFNEHNSFLFCEPIPKIESINIHMNTNNDSYSSSHGSFKMETNDNSQMKQTTQSEGSSSLQIVNEIIFGVFVVDI